MKLVLSPKENNKHSNILIVMFGWIIVAFVERLGSGEAMPIVATSTTNLIQLRN